MNHSHDEKEPWLDRSLSPYFPWLTNEIIIFSLIIGLAIFSRLFNLGARVMSHDESLHTYFSWLLYKGNGYQHNPMMHGPLQFHLLALSYFLFGTTDFSARLPHAIFSILTILLIWKWRRYLGKTGALVTAGLLLISPYMLYYGRYARNEAFVGFFGLLFLYATLRYLETGKARYLFLFTAAQVLNFTSKETAFIYAAQELLFLGIYFISRITRERWANLRYFKGFIITLSLGILLLGATLGFAFYGRTSESLSATQTVAPQVPGQTVSPILQTQSHISWTLILGGLAVIALITAVMLLVYGYGWKAIRKERSFDLVVLLGSFVIPMLVAFPINIIGKLVNPINGWNSLDYNFQTSITLISAIQTGVLGQYFKEFFHQGLVHSALVLVPALILSVLIGLWWNKKLWLLNAAIWYTLFILFFTTFFTNGQGFFTGMVGSLGYWLEQQGVNRGSQPWYYYLLIQIPIYEFLPLMGLLFSIYFGFRKKNTFTSEENQTILEEGNPPESQIGRTLTFPLLLWWSISSIIAYTIAGEKMPWLTYHITLPMILITGWMLGKIIERVNWVHFKRNLGGLLIGLGLIFILGLGAMMVNLLGTNPPFQGKDLNQLSATSSFLFSVLAMAGSGAGIIYILNKMKLEWSQLYKVVFLIFFGVLAVLTTRTAIRAAYINYDNAKEYLVYAHGGRGVKDIMEQVHEISNRTAGENNVIVAYDVSAPDTGVSWPFTWYLRDYPNIRPFDQPTKSLRDAPIIIVDQKNFDKILPVVGDAYYRFDYIRMLWPNQDYFNLTLNGIENALSSPGIRQGIFNIWLNRDFTEYAQAKAAQPNGGYIDVSNYTVANWQPGDKMRLYIRKDVVAQIWNYGVGPTTSSVQADPYEKGMVSLKASLVVGFNGQGDGQLNDPHGIALSPDGSIFVADTNNNRIVHFSPDGTFLSSWGTFGDASMGPVSLTNLNQPWGVAVSPDGKWVYATDTWNHRIIKYDNKGIPVQAWGFSQYGGQDPFGLWGPRGITVDPSGNVFITDTGNKRIIAYDKDGKYLGQIGAEGMDPGQFSEPVGLGFDSLGNLYVADTWNQRVQSFSVSTNPDGTLIFININQWDISGWYGQALENKPYLAVDNSGNIFVTDPLLGRVLEFSTKGDYIRGFGGSGSGDDQIGSASGIAVGSDGQIWVADSLNSRILKFTMP